MLERDAHPGGKCHSILVITRRASSNWPASHAGCCGNASTNAGADRYGGAGRCRPNPNDQSESVLMNFASDNTAPVATEILDAIVQVNAGYAMGYGNDD